jgi:hypothetical protein
MTRVDGPRGTALPPERPEAWVGGVGEAGGADDGVREGRSGDGGAVKRDDRDVGMPLALVCAEGLHTDPASDHLDPSRLASSGMVSSSIPSPP